MSGVSQIRLLDQMFVKLLLVYTRLIACDEQDGSTFGIKRERNSPNAIRCIKSKLFHIRESGTFQCINPRTASLGSKTFDPHCSGHQLVLHTQRQTFVLGVELRFEEDFPFYF